MPFHHKLNYLRMPWGKLAWRERPHKAAGSELTGRSPSALLLHGLGGDVEDWRETVEELPADWRIVVMDFRGHGRSGPPEAGFELDDLAADVLALMQETGLTAAQLIGVGVGGLVALRAAQLNRTQDAIRGLVLFETFTTTRAMGAFRHGRFVAKLPEDRARKLQAKYFTTRDRFHVAFYDRFWASVMHFDAGPFLADTELPVQLIYGGRGRHDRTQEHLQIPARPNIRVQWIEKCGHHLLHEKPLEVAARCRQAIAPELDN